MELRLALIATAILCGTSHADLPFETIGSVEKLSVPPSPHWVFASDAVNERLTLIDLDSGRMLGILDGGFGVTTGAYPKTRNEIYVASTHYSRGSRGERTDVVTIYDATSLAPVDEVVISPKRAINPLPVGNMALSDDDRFLAIFNMTPATSLSIVDLEKRSFAGEIAIPGCSLAYTAGPRRFASLCSNGAMLLTTVDENGRELSKIRSEPFFDPLKDPVTEKAVRYGGVWIFVSFEGWAHPVDLSGDAPVFLERWSLITDSDRRNHWRVGGYQHLAVHQATGRLYALVHQGPPDSHKQGGSEMWIYDLADGRREKRIGLHNPGFTYLGVPIEFGQDWIWPFNGLYGFILDYLVPDLGIGQIAVTQDDEPLIVTGSNFTGMLAIYDGRTGEFRGRVVTGNMTTLLIQAPWGGASQ